MNNPFNTRQTLLFLIADKARLSPALARNLRNGRKLNRLSTKQLQARYDRMWANYNAGVTNYANHWAQAVA